MGEREQARIKKERLEKMSQQEPEGVSKVKKREDKEMDKRERAIQRVSKDIIERHKNDIKVNKVEKQMRETMSKAKKITNEVDSDLASEEEYDEEEESGDDDNGEKQAGSDDKEDPEIDDNSDEYDSADYASEEGGDSDQE